MDTTKSVYNKLFSEDKVELGKHEVELSLISDFQKLTDSFFASGQKFEDSVQKVESAISDMQKKFIEHSNMVSKIDSDYTKLRKSALEFGIPIPSEIESIYKKVLAVMKNDLATFNKYNK